jgi:hypothetical protein
MQSFDHERTDRRDRVSGVPLHPTTTTVTIGDVSNADAVERAVVTYPAPHGVEAMRLFDGQVAEFGRGAECAIRFAYAPTVDRGVPRVAGSFAVVNGRVFVESAGVQGVHRALTIRTDLGVTSHLAVGEGVSPRERFFELIVHGESGPWKLTVAARPSTVRDDAGSTDPPTRHHDLALTESQRRVLDAYSEPIRRGRSEPATHRQVAAALNYHPNTVRESLYEIWALMFAEQIPMPDVDDKRVAVVEAARLHGLLESQ